MALRAAAPRLSMAGRFDIPYSRAHCLCAKPTAEEKAMRRAHFSRFIQKIRASGSLAVQPRMGWGSPLRMRRALELVKAESPNCVGTITLDSYTRVGDYHTPLLCLSNGEHLNGYPLLSHSVRTTEELLHHVLGEDFPVQVRHGTPEPQAVFRRIIEVGLDASEGGPISYCLPYGRTPLTVSMSAWRDSCHIFAAEEEHGHIESFGGCLLGQLCPPALLLAVGILECLFFRQYGIRSVSLSYAQGPSYPQDRAALTLLRKLAGLYLADLDWHVVVYTYMGLFPETAAGGKRLIEDSASLAAESGCERLIVKTTAERRQIPPLKDNLFAIRLALTCAQSTRAHDGLRKEEHEVYEQLSEDVQSVLEAVLNLHSDMSEALLMAFERGILDIPYCLHPDNHGNARGALDEHGMVRWTRPGNVPVKDCRPDLHDRLSSDALLTQLSYVARLYDSSSSTAPDEANVPDAQASSFTIQTPC
jgi:methylaspartate mutase epsilon subunit